MKILLLYKKKAGGVGTVVQSLTKWFEKTGDSALEISREEDMKIYSLIKSIFPIRKKIKRIVTEEKIDIIYTQDWSLALPLLFPSHIFKKKHFCVFYGSNPPGMGKFLQNIVGKMIHKNLIVCNDSLKEKFPDSTLIYNRVDHEIFSPSNKIKKIKNSVGFANWATKEYHFKEIEKAVKEAGKKLIIADGIPKEKMPDFFRKLEIFISLPPDYAGFGLVYLEAMSSGIPKIIGSNYGGGEILPITKIENFGSIKEAILNAKATNYREWIIKNNFTWENAVKKLKGIFKDGIKDN